MSRSRPRTYRGGAGAYRGGASGAVLPAAAVVLLALVATGCGSAESTPQSYPTSRTSVSVDVGEEFSLTVDELPGEEAYLVAPEPDSSVVRSTGSHFDSDDDGEDMVGARNRHVFTFEATGAGSTRIVLLDCLATTCVGGPKSPTPAPAPSDGSSLRPPKRITYTVTVH